MPKIELGDLAKDTITGFTGLIDAKINYLTGCAQYRLQPREIKDGKIIDGMWFDGNRIHVVESQVFQQIVTDRGGPPPVMSAPTYPR